MKVFNEGELDKKSNVHFLHITNSDKPVAFYSLDVIISVGYRVKSKRSTVIIEAVEYQNFIDAMRNEWRSAY